MDNLVCQLPEECDQVVFHIIEIFLIIFIDMNTFQEKCTKMPVNDINHDIRVCYLKRLSSPLLVSNFLSDLLNGVD